MAQHQLLPYQPPSWVFFAGGPWCNVCAVHRAERNDHLASKTHIIQFSKRRGVSLMDAISYALAEQRNDGPPVPWDPRDSQDDTSSAPSVRPWQPLPVADTPRFPPHFQEELNSAAAFMGWECAVCLDALSGDRFALTPCFHKVCKKCLDHLDQCPICRRPLQ